jgi:hypothetical protein
MTLGASDSPRPFSVFGVFPYPPKPFESRLGRLGGTSSRGSPPFWSSLTPTSGPFLILSRPRGSIVAIASCARGSPTEF